MNKTNYILPCDLCKHDKEDYDEYDIFCYSCKRNKNNKPTNFELNEDALNNYINEITNFINEFNDNSSILNLNLKLELRNGIF